METEQIYLDKLTKIIEIKNKLYFDEEASNNSNVETLIKKEPVIDNLDVFERNQMNS